MDYSRCAVHMRSWQCKVPKCSAPMLGLANKLAWCVEKCTYQNTFKLYTAHFRFVYEVYCKRVGMWCLLYTSVSFCFRLWHMLNGFMVFYACNNISKQIKILLSTKLILMRYRYRVLNIYCSCILWSIKSLVYQYPVHYCLWFLYTCLYNWFFFPKVAVQCWQ